MLNARFVITAVVLGGTSLFGGRGAIIRTLTQAARGTPQSQSNKKIR